MNIDLTKQPSLMIKAVQFVVGLIVVFLIYLIAKAAMNADKLVIDIEKDMSLKKVTYVTDGYIDSSQKVTINSTVPFAPNYLPIISSMNIKGGAQFSYQLWMFVEDADKIADKVIFIKGDPTKYTYQLQENKLDISSKQMKPYNKRQVNGRIAKCPMLSFKSGGGGNIEFSVLFNTLHNMNETFDVTTMKSDNSIYRHNLTSILAKQWFLVTVVFQDNMPINDFETGLIVRFYLNDVLYQQKTYKSTLKQNDGDLVIFPDEDLSGCKLSTFTYFNYAISDTDVKTISNKGPVLTPSTTNGAIKNNVMKMSSMNRLDLYNA